MAMRIPWPSSTAGGASALRTSSATGPGLRDVEGDPFGDLQAEALETAVAGGVVGHQAHPRDAEVGEDLGADAVLPAVRWRRQVDLRIDAAGAGERVRHAEPASLVTAQVHEHAGPLLHDAAHRGVEGAAALAEPGAEDVAGEALAVDAHQRDVARRDLAA